ncbi:hypothetical protein L3Q82_000205 [Scortum barcoo]|uniref:Uncharacterized protein n=1 Tax=Scortum barcoo TaxID=214431 RepID=A0ACB8X9I1_9TELE|nr:hypothetical protein L3Q82_000205 [Scortum barcoo]
MQPSSYSSDNAKIGYVVNLLRGKASDWATALWQANSPVLQSFDSFIAEMKKVFDHPVQGQEAVKRLLDLRQGSQSVAAYSVDFRILAAASGWDSLALKGIFYKGLAEKIKDELSLRDEPDSLDSLISLAIRIDNRLRERQRERGTLMPKLAQPASASPPLPLSFAPTPHSPPPVALPSVSEEPMQLGRAKLSPSRREASENAGLPRPGSLSSAKQRPPSLPPHRPYDCPIDLLPGASLPTSRLYNLSRPEREAMEKYISESLAAGLIRPSSSPLGAGFFFVEKKDKTLRPVHRLPWVK